MTEGPSIHALMRRLAETPPEFLEEPRIGHLGAVDTPAVVADLVRDLGGAVTPESVSAFQVPDRRNWLRTVLVACWLLHDRWFLERRTLGAAALQFLTRGLQDMAELIDAPRLVEDPDRREELARSALQALGLRPAGESDAQAEDRRRTLDSVERFVVVGQTRQAAQRRQAILEAMRKKAAQDAAAKVTKE